MDFSLPQILAKINPEKDGLPIELVRKFSYLLTHQSGVIEDKTHQNMPMPDLLSDRSGMKTFHK